MVFIGIGSNLGDSVNIATKAIQNLQKRYPKSFRSSSLYQTSPVNCLPGTKDFINAAVSFEAPPNTTAITLLEELQSIEKAFGKKEQAQPNMPRELDLDLLLFNDCSNNNSQLQLPHPSATERLFVLIPLAEIAPNFIWPTTQKTITEMLNTIKSDEIIKRLDTQAC